MPVSRSSKSEGSHQRTMSPSKSRPRHKAFPCVAWWCNGRFSRQADQKKHIKSIHFGERFYCTGCNIVMNQASNMATHINRHTGNYCSKCSCGKEFTDPSACTRHREADKHLVGPTHRKVRPFPPNRKIESVRVQHRAGIGLTDEHIANPNFKPPLFDTTFLHEGMPRAGKEYDPKDYVIIGQRGAPIPASVQAPGTLPTNTKSTTEYQETAPVERLVTTVANPNVGTLDSSGAGAEFSYDIDSNRQALTESPHVLAFHPFNHHQGSAYGYYTPAQSVPLAPAVPTDLHPYHPMAINSHFIEPFQPFAGHYGQPGYPEVLYAPRVLSPDSVSVSPPCDFFEGIGLNMPSPEDSQLYQPQFEPPHLPGADLGYTHQLGY